MKNIFVAVILIVFFSNGLAAQPKPDVLHYRFALTLNDLSDTIAGTSDITVVFPACTDSFFVDLSGQNAEGKGMRVIRVEQNGKALSYRHQADKIAVRLPGCRPGDTLTFSVSYQGIPADGLIISKNKYGRRTFFSDNWPDRAHNWIACVDDPSDKATVEFIVTAPDHYRIISNGQLQNETSLPGSRKQTHWGETVPLPAKVMVIGAADFAVESSGRSIGNIPVSSWVFPENKEAGFANYAIAPGILSFFEDYIGPYPYEKLANVQSKTIFGGMENASAIFYYEASAFEKRNEESLIAHEIVHQWFGNMATEKHFSHLWLSEGFATYLTHIYIGSIYGRDSLTAEMRKDRKQIIAFAAETDRPVVDSVSSLMELLNANSYQKGSWFLHMLRHKLGDAAFHTVIKSYYEKYKGSNATTEDFRHVAETVSGQSLAGFFHQWLYRPGIPRVKLSWKYIPARKAIAVTVKQVQKEPAFAFPLEIELSGKGIGAQKEKLSVTKLTETFLLPIKNADKIRAIRPDPATVLLFEEK